MRTAAFALLFSIFQNVGLAFASDLSTAKQAYDTQNYKVAFNIYSALAEQGNDVAQNMLGIMYRDGLWIPPDRSEAIRWFNISAVQGNAYGQSNLGRELFSKGSCFSSACPIALSWTRKSAEQGNVSAQVHLGMIHRMGWGGVAVDVNEAMKWLSRAVQQGSSAAAIQIALMLSKSDPNKSVEWRKRALELGDDWQSFELGIIYEKGRGAIQDYEESIKWFTIAAENHPTSYSISAMEKLGQLHQQIDDLIVAHMWLNIASSLGSKSAPISRFELTPKLSSKDLLHAQKIARECVAEKYKGC